MRQATNRETLELKAALAAGRAFKAAKKAKEDASKAMEATEEWKAYVNAMKAHEASDAFKVWEDASDAVKDARKTYEELWATVKASEVWQHLIKRCEEAQKAA
mgnify:CR=1 FL=1